MGKKIALLLLIIGFLVACNDKQQRDKALPKPLGLEKEFTLGGAPIKVVVYLSQTEIALTDFLILSIRIESDESIRVSEPFLGDYIFTPLLIVENPRQTQHWDKKGKQLIQNWDYKLEPMSSGEFEIQPFIVNFRVENEKTKELSDWPVHSIHTEKIPYAVTSVTIDSEEELRDVKGPILPAFKYLYVILSILFCLLCLVGYFFIQKLKGRGLSEKPEVTPVNYYLEALRKLDQLENSEWIQQENYEAVFVELSSILRRYIEKFFHLKAEEQTTEEFIREIASSSRFTGEQNHILHQFLSFADLVKFATYDPDQETSKEAIKTIRDFVTVTGSSHEI